MTIEELRSQLAALRGVIDRADTPQIAKDALEVKATAIGKQIADAEFEATKEQRTALNVKLNEFVKGSKALNDILAAAEAIGAVGFSYSVYLDANGVQTRDAKLVFPGAAPKAKRTAKEPKAEGTRASKLYQNVATGEIQRLDGVYQDLATADERAKMAGLDKADASYNSKAWRIKADVLERVMGEGKVVAA